MIENIVFILSVVLIVSLSYFAVYSHDKIDSLEFKLRDYKSRNSALLTRVERLTKENLKLQQELNSWAELYDVKLTAYCPCEECSSHWGKSTKSGIKATKGRTVAVDPNVIKIGSEVKINGHTYIAEDVGGGVKGLHIDIYMDNHKDTENFGVKYTDVKVKEK